MQSHNNIDLADLLERYFETPDLFDLDEELMKELVECKEEIKSLFANATDANTKLICAGSLARIDRSNDEQVLLILMKGLKGGDDIQLVFAASCLGELGLFAAPAIPLLVKMMKCENDDVVFESAKTLGRIGAESIPHLIDALDSVTSCAGNAAASSLGEMGAVAMDAIPVLQRCLDLDKTGNYWAKGLRLMAADAIWKITGDNTHVLAVASELLDDDDVALCARACAVLAEQRDAARPYADKFQELLHHQISFVRRTAAEALVRCWFS